MDTHKMRADLPSLVKQSIEAHPGYAEFAAWCKRELIHPHSIYFLIWQASRAAVVVELPPALRGLVDVDDVAQLIEAQGLKVTP
ncbi:hypothetical protein [Pseudomonas fulva]|uniref:hypothetical protein n=1 Tax=Pseudomonas fulva TaxID=47880 RepID=UPI0006726313|nr:hypothetical protein [Pseudomonas fulva]WHU44540.1 hypothetical protein OXL99_12065 [Pseudomonas fulva]